MIKKDIGEQLITLQYNAWTKCSKFYVDRLAVIPVGLL